jgi:hypothetical protein
MIKMPIINKIDQEKPANKTRQAGKEIRVPPTKKIPTKRKSGTLIGWVIS